MARKPSVKFFVTGDRTIDKRLRRLESKLQRKVVRQALRKAMKPIRADVIRLAPKDTGAISKGIKLRAGKRSRRGFRMEIRTEGPHDYIASFHEFGTRKLPAQPFMRPAFDKNKQTSRAILLSEMWAGIRRELRG